MLRFLQTWVPAIAFLGAVGFASIALTLDRPSAPATVVRTATAADDQAEALAPRAPSNEAELQTESDRPAAARPSGVLTYLTGEGGFVTVDIAERSFVGEPVADHPARASSAGGVYPSPDGRYLAAVRRDALGVWIDVSAGERRLQSLAVAGPDDPTAVAGPKALAAAVAGVPLTVAWSPNSSHLAYGSITGTPFALAVVETRTWSTSFRQVAGGYVGELAWAPDSSRLAVSTYELDRSNHTVLMYNPRTTVIRGLIDGCAIVWAPDAAFLAVHREPTVGTGVWITSPDGGLRIEVSDDPLAFPVSWAADTSWIAPDSLALLALGAPA